MSDPTDGVRFDTFGEVGEPVQATADLPSRLGWLPCEECGQTGTQWTDRFSETEGDYQPESCDACHGIGWLPSPAVLEAMATALAQAICGDDICVSDEGCMADHREEARAAWEAQARLILEGEK
jgi:hypothetical protein